MADEPTRKELAEQLAAERADKAEMTARLERLEAAFAANTETAGQRLAREKLLAQAEAELAALRPGAARALDLPRGPAPKMTPYKGWVRARVDCAYGCYRHGPDQASGRLYGDIFEVEVPTLWSDDPWEAILLKGYEDDGRPIVELNTTVTPVDKRFRQRAPDMGLLAANQV